MIQNKKSIASILFVLISFVCSAQTPGGGPPPPQPPPGPGFPIDGGLVILMVLGFSYGIYKIIKLKKQASV